MYEPPRPVLPPSEFVAVGVAVLPNHERRTPERLTTAYELSWMIEGAAIAYIDGKIYDLPWHGMLLLRPGERVAFDYFPDSARARCHHGFVHFTLPGTPVRDDWPRTHRLAADGVLLGLLEHILWLYDERPEHWKDSLHEAIRYATRVFITGSTGRFTGGETAVHEVVTNALRPLAQAWTDGSPLPTPSLDELAAAAGVSRAYLCRVFAREVGMSPLSTARLLRLSRAATLLRLTALPVAEVGRSTGFPSEFHFSRSFRKQFGVPPTRYRDSVETQYPELPEIIHRLGGILAYSPG